VRANFKIKFRLREKGAPDFSPDISSARGARPLLAQQLALFGDHLKKRREVHHLAITSQLPELEGGHHLGLVGVPKVTAMRSSDLPQIGRYGQVPLHLMVIEHGVSEIDEPVPLEIPQMARCAQASLVGDPAEDLGLVIYWIRGNSRQAATSSTISNARRNCSRSAHSRCSRRRRSKNSAQLSGGGHHGRARPAAKNTPFEVRQLVRTWPGLIFEFPSVPRHARQI